MRSSNGRPIRMNRKQFTNLDSNALFSFQRTYATEVSARRLTRTGKLVIHSKNLSIVIFLSSASFCGFLRLSLIPKSLSGAWSAAKISVWLGIASHRTLLGLYDSLVTYLLKNFQREASMVNLPDCSSRDSARSR